MNPKAATARHLQADTQRASQAAGDANGVGDDAGAAHDPHGASVGRTEARCVLDAAGYVVISKQALHDARHTVNGRCRYCNGITNPDLHPGRQAGHEMRCRFYVGPLEHRWVRTGWNGTFGGVDHHCVCGGWFRLGGIAGHGDGTENATPVCPHANETYRGDQ